LTSRVRTALGVAIGLVTCSAVATVNCRVLPGGSMDEVQKSIVQALGNPAITVTRVSSPVASPPSPLRSDVVRSIRKLTAEFWPGTPVVPPMSTGATDSRFLQNIGIPCYGISGLFTDPADNRSHGLNERMPVKSLYDGQEFLYRLVRGIGRKRRGLGR